MRIKDILTAEEDNKVQELKLELLEAHNEKERSLIMAEIEQIFDSAKKRYYSMLNGTNEQAATNESYLAFRGYNHVMQ